MEDFLFLMVSGFRVPFLLMTHFISDSPPFVLLLTPLSLSSSQRLLPPYYMSFSTNFQPTFHYSGDRYYDNIYSSFPEPPEARAQAELACLNCALVVPEFADSTPLDLFDRDGGVISAAPHWSWEAVHTTVIPRAH